MNDRALARRIEDEPRVQGCSAGYVDPQVLRQLAARPRPDEEAEEATRRDEAERALAGMELRWTRTEGPES